MTTISKWKSHGLGNIYVERFKKIRDWVEKNKLYSCNDEIKNTSCLTNLKTI